MNIAYVKVSTIEQNEGIQLEGLKKYNIDSWFSEKVSAKDTNRPELKRMIEFARKDDTIYIHSLDRLARSTKDLLDIVEQLQSKGIHLVSTKENIDTNTATGTLMLTMIGAINTFERENMLERQREGIAIAKENGAYAGRKAIEYPKDWKEVYSKYKTRELTGTKAMDILGLKRNTFYKLVKEHTSKKCAICGEKIGFSSGKFISEKYVCNTCYELNEKKKLSEPQEEKESGLVMGRGLSYMADASTRKDIW